MTTVPPERHLVWSNRCAPGLCFVLGQNLKRSIKLIKLIYCLCSYLFVDVSALFRGLKISLDFAELGKVEGSDLLGFLDLLLVALHLVLQLVHQLLHPLVVLGVMSVSQRKDDPTKKEQIKTLWSSS